MTAIAHFNAAGACVGFFAKADSPLTPAPPPGGTTLDIDPATNAAVVAAIRDDPAAYTLVGGQLRRSGQPVAIAADSQAGARRKQLRAALATLDQPLPGNATLADVRQRVNLLSRGVAMLLEREFGGG